MNNNIIKRKVGERVCAFFLAIIMMLGFMPEYVANAESVNSTRIDVKVNDITYNGSPQELIKVEGLWWLDKVIYTYGGNESSNIPTATNAGIYWVGVRVENFLGTEIFNAGYNIEIKKKDIDDVEFGFYNGMFDNAEHKAVTTIAGIEAYDVEYYVGGGVVDNIENFFVKEIGEYPVEIVLSKDNYNTKVITGSAIVFPTTTSAIKIDINDKLIYNGEEQNLIKTVESTSDLLFSIDDGTTWVTHTDIKGKDAQKYEILVKNKEATNILEDETRIVYISKNVQNIQFNVSAYNEDETHILKPEVEYDFSVEAAKDSNITYKVLDMNYKEADPQYITIDQFGKLTATHKDREYYLQVLVKNKNYKDVTLQRSIRVGNKYVVFDKDSVEYVYGSKKDNVISTLSARRIYYYNDMGEISYKIIELKEDSGIGIDKENGTVTITDAEKLYSSLVDSADGKLQYEVKVEKKEIIGEGYPLDTDTYNLSISLENTPDNPIVVYDDKNNVITKPNGKNDWYNTPILVLPGDKDNYSILDTYNYSENFSSVIRYDENFEQGEKERKVYLKKNGGGITAPINTNIDKFDCITPDVEKIEIEYSGDLYTKEGIEAVISGFDYESGIEEFVWEYVKLDDANDSIKASYGGTAKAKGVGNGKYNATIKLPENKGEQLKGYLKVKAVDFAGNISEEKMDDGNIIIVDNILPVSTVEFKSDGKYQKIGDKQYYSDKVNTVITIKEANFAVDNVEVNVVKDGQKYNVGDLEWSSSKQDDNNTTSFLLKEDGEYVISLEYQDVTGEKMDSYVSDVIVVDTIKPIIEFDFDGINQIATISVQEKNFQKTGLSVITVAKDINGKDIKANDLQAYLRSCEWKKEGEKYSATISKELVDARYILKINYVDLAQINADEYITEEFVVDRIGPEIESMKISYSVPLASSMISGMVFGYYNPVVVVTFSADDNISGIGSFEWEYSDYLGTGQVGVTGLNGTLSAVQNTNDKSSFSAQIKLPYNIGNQLKGRFSFTAIDNNSNTSQVLSDMNNVIVVDTISPTLSLEYSPANKVVGNKMYYNKSATLTFLINEENFYEQDVNVEIEKNGVAIKSGIVWTNKSGNSYVGVYTIDALADHSNDGEYIVKVAYSDKSGNSMNQFVSDIIVIDTINPKIDVEYKNTNVINTDKNKDGNEVKYYNEVQTALVTITEQNFDPNQVSYSIVSKDVSGNIIGEKLYSVSNWSSSGDKNYITIEYPGDANYIFDIECVDISTNKNDEYATDYFTVDTSKPNNLSISYSQSLLDIILSNISFGFYNSQVTVTISATDNISGVNAFKYSYVKDKNASSINSELINQLIGKGDIAYSNDGSIATATFSLPKELLNGNNQFNGTVKFDATDKSGNVSDVYDDTKRIVVDNIAPNAVVEYNAPANTVDGISYYDDSIYATIRVNEANFYSEDVSIVVTKDGNEYNVATDWANGEEDIHIGTFSLSEDGEYLITVSYMDKSNNIMQQYESGKLVIDTKLNAPIITINGAEADGKAFKDEVIPEISFEDENLDSFEIILTRTNFDEKNVDVTDIFIKGNIINELNSYKGYYDTFEKIKENDGIYFLTVRVYDKSKHVAEKNISFTVNRYGSVYEYDNYLLSLISNGGSFVNVIDEDLIIKEYNSDRLLSESLVIQILKDGRPIDNVKYTVTPEINSRVSVGEKGWYQYQYAIDKNNFAEDGIYKITISSKDATGNTPENNNQEGRSILFRVDTTAPEINSITGLEKKIINAVDVEVKYTVYDTIGLSSIQVYVDGKEIDNITDFAGDVNNYTGKFVLSENNSVQTVRIVVKDLAGNSIDTASADFVSSYEFNDSVLITTNLFIRWYADPTLFWGSIGGVALATITTFGIILIKKKKRVNENQK